MKDILKVKEMIANYEANELNDVELLSAIIGEKATRSLIENGYNNLKSISDENDNVLIKIPNIGNETLIKIRAVIEIGKRQIYYNSDGKMSSPKDIFDYCKDMQSFDQEVFRIICLNTKNKIIGSIDIFKGSLNSSIVHPREIFREALKRNCAKIVAVHNHPSGDPEPSKEDISVTIRIKEAGAMLGVELIDHVVIGNDCYYSLKAKKHM